MKKIAIAAMVALAVSGCVPSSVSIHGIDDNSPDEREREAAYWRCVGVHQYSGESVGDDIRIACTAAIYGGRS